MAPISRTHGAGHAPAMHPARPITGGYPKYGAVMNDTGHQHATTLMILQATNETVIINLLNMLLTIKQGRLSFVGKIQYLLVFMKHFIQITAIFYNLVRNNFDKETKRRI